MNVIDKSIFIVLKRFPDNMQAIKHLFRESEEFQIICEDYRQCNEALSYWTQSSQMESQVRSQEYAILLGELEEEIARHLNEADAE